jgi:hypothetical protein
MPYPADISLPTNAKCFSFKNNTAYNSNYDITWSYSCLISSVSAQHGFCTYLTTLSTAPLSALSGQYIGSNIPNNIASIAFDTTGLFALSSDIRPGVPLNQVKLSSLVVRNSSNQVVYNQSLTGTGFSFYNTHQVIRCRFSYSQQLLVIDYRKVNNSDFINLATIPFSISLSNLTNLDNVYTGFSFCTPISTTNTAVASAFVYNFHTDGVRNNTSVETITSAPLI